MKTSPPHPDDPFAGYGPQSVRCRWLSPDDQDRASSAAVIRLIVDENRWANSFSNAVYQRNVLRELASFIGPTKAIVVTPAGMITTTSDYLEGTLASVAAGRRLASVALGDLDRGASPFEVLLGIDGCVAGEATPFQGVVHLAGGGRTATAANTTLKLYPSNGEKESLVGWRVVSQLGDVPVELGQARRIATTAGWFLVLVCHDACVFSARSQANLKDGIRLTIRKHFKEAAETCPAFTLIATHTQDAPRSGGVFKNAATVIAKETGGTVVTTMFAPAKMMEEIASSFPVRGDRGDEVVTLLVEDSP